LSTDANHIIILPRCNLISKNSGLNAASGIHFLFSFSPTVELTTGKRAVANQNELHDGAYPLGVTVPQYLRQARGS
jgi:hypothetical protein